MIRHLIKDNDCMFFVYVTTQKHKQLIGYTVPYSNGSSFELLLRNKVPRERPETI